MKKQFNKTMLMTALLMVPGFATAVELTDYKDPNSTAEEAYINGSLDAKSGNQDQSSYNVNLDGYYDIFYSTQPRTWNFRFDGAANSTRSAEEGANSQKSYNFTAGGDVRNYAFPSNDKLFWFGSTDVGYRRLAGAAEADDPFVKLGLGVGYGRVIEATPLAKVLRIVEELREYGVIQGTPNDTTYMQLASVVAKEAEYKTRFGLEDYKQNLFKDFETILRGAGLLVSNNLGAVGVLKMEKVLFDEPISVRKHGWVTGIGLGYIASNYDGESDDAAAVDVFAEYAKPYGYRGQFINRTDFSTTLDSDSSQLLTNNMSYTHEISDMVDWENVWKLSHLKPAEDNQEDVTTNILSTAFRYHLSNRMDTVVSLKLTDVEDNVDDNGNDDLESSLNVGLRYRLK